MPESAPPPPPPSRLAIICGFALDAILVVGVIVLRALGAITEENTLLLLGMYAGLRVGVSRRNRGAPPAGGGVMSLLT